MSNHNKHYKETKEKKSESSSEKGKLLASLGIIAAVAAERLTSQAATVVNQTITEKVEKKKRQIGFHIASHGLILIGGILLAYGLISWILEYFNIEQVNIISGLLFVLAGCLLMESYKK